MTNKQKCSHPGCTKPAKIKFKRPPRWMCQEHAQREIEPWAQMNKWMESYGLLRSVGRRIGPTGKLETIWKMTDACWRSPALREEIYKRMDRDVDKWVLEVRAGVLLLMDEKTETETEDGWYWDYDDIWHRVFQGDRLLHGPFKTADDAAAAARDASSSRATVHVVEPEGRWSPGWSNPLQSRRRGERP